MRGTLHRNAMDVGSPIKQLLRSELRELEAKASKYEQMLSQSRHIPRQDRATGGQIETLFLQGANIAEEGQRLMRVRSKPCNYRII